MERQQAVKILNALANGAHPVTGEVFPADSPYQHPDTVRALFEAVRALGGALNDIERQPQEATPSAFVRWTPEEEERLAAAFDAGKSSVELATAHNRSRAAIEARLLKLGKIDVSALTVQLRYRGAPAPKLPTVAAEGTLRWQGLLMRLCVKRARFTQECIYAAPHRPFK